MKKLLLAVLVLLGLQTQAQVTCDSITTTYLSISPDTIKVETNVMNLGISGMILHSFDLYEGGWNGLLTHYDTNVVASIPLPSPNVVDTFVLCNWSDFMVPPYACYSCDTFAWNGSNWAMMNMVQQETPINYNPCDSLNYSTTTSINYPFGVHGTVQPTLNNDTDTVEFNWTVCGGGLCYSATGLWAFFGQITYQDTLKVCYDAYTIVNNNIDTVCSSCDSLIFDGMNWVLFNMSNPTSIQETMINKINNSKIYDLLGREIIGDIPNNTMYIQNGKKYIKIK
jgi:hypothetical protein